MIESFANADLDAVAAIWLETNIACQSFIPASYWHANMARVRSMFLEADLFVHRVRGGIGGFVGLVGGNIAGLFVSPGWQRHGIGSGLIRFCQAGHHRLELAVYSKNITAFDFYLKMGFTSTMERIEPETRELERRMIWQRRENRPDG